MTVNKKYRLVPNNFFIFIIFIMVFGGWYLGVEYISSMYHIIGIPLAVFLICVFPFVNIWLVCGPIWNIIEYILYKIYTK